MRRNEELYFSRQRRPHQSDFRVCMTAMLATLDGALYVADCTAGAGEGGCADVGRSEADVL